MAKKIFFIIILFLFIYFCVFIWNEVMVVEVHNKLKVCGLQFWSVDLQRTREM